MVLLTLFYRFVPEERMLEIEIEEGMRDGQEYPFVAEGTYRYKLSISGYSFTNLRKM